MWSVDQLSSAASNAGLSRWEEFSFGRSVASSHLLCSWIWTCRDPVPVHRRSGAGGNLSLLGSSWQSPNGWYQVLEPRSLVYRLDGRSWWIGEVHGQVDIHLEERRGGGEGRGGEEERGKERKGEIEREDKGEVLKEVRQLPYWQDHEVHREEC